eukprot:m.96730 g.96730  ORF g.96730 m.96730 type:complete len:543 (+) comp8643_c0_seq1:85-1713(+)
MVSKLASTAAVDRFLHRKLPEDQYRSLRAVEPCVVSCTPDARAVKFVALSDDGLYVCENPPRKVQLLLVYSDISQVEVVHDIPKFLQHEVGEKVVHLRLHKGRMAERASRADLSPNPSPRNIQRGFNALSVSPQPVRAPSPLSGEPHSPKALNPLSRVTSWVSRKSGSLSTLMPASAQIAPKRLSLGSVGPDPPSPKPSRRADDPVSEDEEASSLGSSLDLREVGLPSGYIDIYTLQEPTSLLPVLESAIIAAAIRATNMSLVVPTGGRTSEDQQVLLLRGLMKELASSVEIEECFELVDELQAAVNTSRNMKRLFWRAGEYYVTLVGQLARHSGPGDCTAHAKADGIEYAAAVAQLLALLLHDADAPDRFAILRLPPPHSVHDVLTCICVPPNGRHWPNIDPGLQAEQRRAAIALLYEIIVLARQISGQPECAGLGPSWTTALANAPAQAFAMSVFSEFLTLLDQPASFHEGPEPIMLYKRAVICLSLLRPGTPLAEKLKNMYKEEFRYMVRLEVLRQRLVCVPVGAHTLACLVEMRDLFL